MQEVKFDYQTVQGKPVKPDASVVDIDGFESEMVNKIFAKYEDNIMSPRVVVILPEDGSKIVKAHLLGDELLKME